MSIYVYICIYIYILVNNGTRATRLQRRAVGFTRRTHGVTCVTSR